jgi:hypothetical protein
VTLAKLGGVEVRARESRAKLRTWDEAAILASPVWTRVEDAILAALDAPADADEATKAIYAAIMRRVADALEELGTAA